MGSSILVAILLPIAIAFALGFWILINAVKQENWLRVLGLILGWIIIGLTAVYILMSILDMISLYNTRKQIMQNYRSMEMTQQRQTQTRTNTQNK